MSDEFNVDDNNNDGTNFCRVTQINNCCATDRKLAHTKQAHRFNKRLAPVVNVEEGEISTECQKIFLVSYVLILSFLLYSVLYRLFKLFLLFYIELSPGIGQQDKM